jgi:preprotein translocase subunit SecA
MLTWADIGDDELRDMSAEEIRLKLSEGAVAEYELQETELGEEAMRQVERMLLLQHTDQFWKDHLLAMDRLREGIGLRGYGQRNPLLEYKKEGTSMFMMMCSIRDEAVMSQLLRMEFAKPEEEEEVEIPEVSKRAAKRLVETGSLAPPPPPKAKPVAKPKPRRPAEGEEARAAAAQLGLRRNDPCPCGSGKKFKKCCYENQGAASPQA